MGIHTPGGWPCQCCSHTGCVVFSDTFTGADGSNPSGSWIEDAGNWTIQGNQVQVGTSSAHLRCLETHPSITTAYSVQVKATGNAQGDKLQLYADNGTVVIEAEWGETGYDGRFHLYVSGVLKGSADIVGLEPGIPAIIRICSDGTKVHAYCTGAATLSAIHTVTSAVCGLKTGAVSGNVQFDDYSWMIHSSVSAECPPCGASCLFFYDEFNRPDGDPGSDWTVGSGWTISSKQLQCTAGGTAKTIDLALAHPDSSAEFSAQVVVSANKGAARFRVYVNTTYWIEIEWGGSGDESSGVGLGRARLGNGAASTAVIYSASIAELFVQQTGPNEHFIGGSTAIIGIHQRDGFLSFAVSVLRGQDYLPVAQYTIDWASPLYMLRLRAEVAGDSPTISVSRVAVSRANDPGDSLFQSCAPDVTYYPDCPDFGDSFDRYNGSTIGPDWIDLPNTIPGGASGSWAMSWLNGAYSPDAGWNLALLPQSDPWAQAHKRLLCAWHVPDARLNHLAHCTVTLRQNSDEAVFFSGSTGGDDFVYIRVRWTGDNKIATTAGICVDSNYTECYSSLTSQIDPSQPWSAALEICVTDTFVVFSGYNSLTGTHSPFWQIEYTVLGTWAGFEAISNDLETPVTFTDFYVRTIDQTGFTDYDCSSCLGVCSVCNYTAPVEYDALWSDDGGFWEEEMGIGLDFVLIHTTSLDSCTWQYASSQSYYGDTECLTLVLTVTDVGASLKFEVTATRRDGTQCQTFLAEGHWSKTVAKPFHCSFDTDPGIELTFDSETRRDGETRTFAGTTVTITSRMC